MPTSILQSTQKQTNRKVFLVGAGPGNPDLLTVKALRLIQSADCVIYDRLVSAEIMSHVPKDALCLFVGKEAGFHSLPQDEINDLIVKQYHLGKSIIRLKGGDPYTFGRGGEEAEILCEANIPFEVVPGITAAAGCSAAVGIPLTHRNHAQSVRYITGHLKKGKLDLDWPSFSSPNQTLVFYMGLGALETITQQLLNHGCPSTLEVALIERGTTPQQRLLTGNLSNIAKRCLDRKMKSPCLIIIGSVVSLSNILGQLPNEAEKFSIDSEVNIKQAM
ncbi:uroporphyrinogen-III C-methyltransferase [Neptunomonas sp.]|uniref:uroporphyrinogen-III C-methyltransferase n=1 Tax=Neptunomonas sp. TaxID=1971898 RepID=UPI0025F8A882|nr:uroporphyrinogen-III C-methyltransferase [Neptunomonas sp.]